MSHSKPFHRNLRAMKPGPNSGYSGWAYIVDKEYAQDPAHYIRAYIIIQKDLEKIFDYIEPSDECLNAYSYRIHELLMRTCIEIEANFKAIFAENTFGLAKGRHPTIDVYRKINVTHHLSSYRAALPIWNGGQKEFCPFAGWSTGTPLPWYQAYNASKHDRHEEFKRANMQQLLNAVTALLIVLTSQFGAESFSSGYRLIAYSGDEYHDGKAAIGSLFRIKYPEDWIDDELYNFDWSVLRNESVRFEKIDYDRIP
ncbi:hypothetical protein [Methylocystis suflitae]|uniref:hypothetical protein n=1 Tax=Methylocystis suflitae TaxID=2951405 RepID=UPI00210DBAB0|nr:hypothetical protein [Methylocystis suflitae]MCQ4190071.1 hypothetical protein [Methylocystis suflitae]